MFDGLVFSGPIKLAKPNKEFFNYALKKFNIKACETVFIGNEWNTDIKGALKYNIDAIYIHSNLSKDYERDESVKYILDENLLELKNIYI